jgi:hypothetical protein
MYFKIIKTNKTPERVFLDEHPLVRFIDYPMSSVFITDGVGVREMMVDVKASRIDLIDRLKREQNIKNKMFVIYEQCEDTVFSNITYNPHTFDPVRYIRFAEIQVSPAEWKYMMKDKLKEREETYQEFLFNENKSRKNYKFLLIGR